MTSISSQQGILHPTPYTSHYIPDTRHLTPYTWQGIGLIEKKSKNNIQWKGCGEVEGQDRTDLEELQSSLAQLEAQSSKIDGFISQLDSDLHAQQVPIIFHFEPSLKFTV